MYRTEGLRTRLAPHVCVPYWGSGDQTSTTQKRQHRLLRQQAMDGTLQLLDDTPPYGGNIFTGDIYISPIKLFVGLVSHSTCTTFKGNASVAIIATIQCACAVIVSFPDLSMVHRLGTSLVFSSILPSEKPQRCWFTCRLENITYCKTTKSRLAPSLKHRSIHPTDVTFHSSLQGKVFN